MSEVRGSSREELPHVRGQGWQLGRATPAQGQGWWPEELPHTEARGGSLEERPHIQGAVAVQAQEGLEELFHIQGQEGRWCGDTPRPR